MGEGRSLTSTKYSAEYSELISQAAHDLKDNFGALASPTLSKQETVTFLYETILAGTAAGHKSPPFPWRRVFEFIPRLAWAFFCVTFKSLFFRVQNVPKDAVVFKTWLVPKSLLGLNLGDDYFRDLIRDLQVTEEILVTYSTLDVGLIRRFLQSKKEKNHVLSDGLLNFRDVVRLFRDYLKTGLFNIKNNYFLNGINVSGYIRHSILLDFLCLRSFEAYAEKYRCERLAKSGIKSFVYIFENQSWEKVCCKQFAGRGIHCIGYQSSGFSPLFLNFFPTETDAKNQPMPDTLLTVGENFRRYLTEHGHYKIPVKTFAALRFPYTATDGIFRVTSPNPRLIGRILYAFSVHLEQYQEIVSDLITVFKDSGLEVDLKLHPLYQSKDLPAMKSLPWNFHIVNQVETEKIAENYDCVLFNDNSFGIESLLNGVKSYQYNRNGVFHDDRFIYFSLWNVNLSFPDLIKLRVELRSGIYNKDFDVDATIEYINLMYRPYGPPALAEFKKILSAESPK